MGQRVLRKFFFSSSRLSPFSEEGPETEISKTERKEGKMVEEPSLPRELSPAFTTSLVTHPEGWAGLAAGAVLEGSESPAGERQLWPSRKPRLKWKRCVGCGLTGCESLPLTGEEELGQIGQFQWPQLHTAPRAHQESGPAVSFRGLTLENRESVVRSLLKSQQLPSMDTHET